MTFWKPISTFPLPTKEWDYNVPRYLFGDESGLIVLGRCILTDAEEKSYKFEYDSNGYDCEPKYWAEIPELPKAQGS